MSIPAMAYLNTNSTGQPLFIVDRDWLKQGSKARKSWTGNVRNCSLYGLAIRHTEQSRPEKSRQRMSKPRSRPRRLDRRADASISNGPCEQEHDVHNPSAVVQTESNMYAFDSVVKQSAATTNHFASVSTTSTDVTWSIHLPLLPSPSSAIPGYEQIEGLDCDFDYCKYLHPAFRAPH